MDLIVTATDNRTLAASYHCECGCEPIIRYQRDQATQTTGCCCGSQFAIGTNAVKGVAIPPRYQMDQSEFTAPWGERLQAAWSIDRSALQGTEPHHQSDDL